MLVAGRATANGLLLGSPPASYRVILLAGQSNASGYGHFLSLVNDPTNGLILQLPDGSSGPAVLAAEPLDNPDLNAQPSQGLDRIGFALAFCRNYLTALPPNTGIIIVPAAYEGTGLVGGPWQSGTPGGMLYENAITQVTRALALPRVTGFDGVLWHQGENDVNDDVPTFKAALDAAIAGFRARISGATNSWFILGGMVPEWVGSSPGPVAIQAALADTPNRNTKCAYWGGAVGQQDSANGFDTVHYSAPGQLLNGAAAFAAGRASALF